MDANEVGRLQPLDASFLVLFFGQVIELIVWQKKIIFIHTQQLQQPFRTDDWSQSMSSYCV